MASISRRARPDLWARPDPQIVLAGACILSFILASVTAARSAFAGLVIGYAMLLAGGIGWRPVFGRIAAVNVFVLFMWLVVPFTTPGEALWQWRWLALSSSGAELCLLLTLKANAILALFLALVAPMPVSVLGRGLAGLHFPERLAWLLILMERNVHLLGAEWHKLREAALLRCFEPRCNLATYRALGAMLAQLLLSAHDRGIALHEAMLLAGFDGSLPWRPTLAKPRADTAFALFISLCAALILYV